MWFHPALAQVGQAPGGQGLVGFLLPIVLIFVVFYFLLIRPQQKKAKEHRGMVGAVKRGDQVVTAGGIKGKITKVGEEGWITVQIAPDVRIEVVRATLADVLTKPEPAKDTGAKK